MQKIFAGRFPARIHDVYNVAVPARSEITMRANANMMDRSLGMLVRCVKCKNVLSVYNNTITSAVGINEYFSN